MFTATLLLTLHHKPVEKVDLYLSLGGPGLGIVAKDLRHRAFTLGITAEGLIRSLRVIDMQDQGGVFAEAARFFMDTNKIPNNLKSRLISACASEGSKILSLHAAKQNEEIFSQAKLEIKVRACPARASSAGVRKADLQLA